MIMKCCPWVVCGSVCGGEKRKSEKGRIRKGINVLFATPGRALDHLLKTESFCVDNLEWLVIDEADRLFDMGFEKQLSAIVDQLNLKKKTSPENRARSVVLVSATITKKVLELASTCSVRAQNPVVLKSSNKTSAEDVERSSRDVQMPANLSQYFTITHFKQRLTLLASFLLTEFHKKKNSKIIVFFSTCDSVDFHTRLFQDEVGSGKDELGGFGDVFRCLSLHGKMAQSDRKTGTHQPIKAELFHQSIPSHLSFLSFLRGIKSVTDFLCRLSCDPPPNSLLMGVRSEA
jgi:ATP-dependent RNA helicase DDX31/DBP7